MEVNFSADRPIKRTEQDRLGRAKFARALAHAITSWRGDDSLVLALYGSWGSGKTSVKNLLLEHLQSIGSPIDVAEISPWQKSSSREIADSFFADVGTILGRSSASKRDRQAAKKWREYSARVRVGGTALSGLRPLALTLLAGMAAGSLVVQPYVGATLFVALLVIATAAVALPWIAGLLGDWAHLLETRSEAGAKTLDELKQEMAALLSKRNRTILVVLDDLDRLTPRELRRTIRLVKANCDLPKLVFLLCAAREIVEKQLGPDVDGGRRFLEKIVQVGFDVPLAEREQLDAILLAQVDRIVAVPSVERGFDEKRWNELYRTSLVNYFDTARDIHRFLSSLQFQVGLFVSDDTFEANVIDLIALEVLRVFEPDLYRRLARMKGHVTERHEESPMWGTSVADAQKALQDALNLVPEARRGAATELLKGVFPYVNLTLQGKKQELGKEDEWIRDLRAASDRYFDRYFRLAVAPTDISQRVVRDILENAGDHGRTLDAFSALHDSGQLLRALDLLEAYKEQIPREGVAPLVTAVFDTESWLPLKDPALFSATAEVNALRLGIWGIGSLPTQEERDSALLRVVTDTRGLFLPAKLMAWAKEGQQNLRDVIGVKPSTIPEAEGLLAKRIAAAAETGELQKHQQLVYLIYRWREWGEPAAPSEWLGRVASSSDGALDLVRAMFGLNYGFRMSDLMEVFPLSEIRSQVERLATDSLSNEDAALIEKFLAALRDSTP